MVVVERRAGCSRVCFCVEEQLCGDSCILVCGCCQVAEMREEISTKNWLLIGPTR